MQSFFYVALFSFRPDVLFWKMRRFGVKVHSNTYLKQTEGAWPFCVASVIHRRATLRRQDLAAEMFDFCCQPSKQSTLMLMKGSSAKVMKKAGSNHIYTRSIDIAWWYGCHTRNIPPMIIQPGSGYCWQVGIVGRF